MPRELHKNDYADFRGGQNSKLAPYLLKPSELTMARNVWWDSRGQIEKRPGYVRACAAETTPPSNTVQGAQMYYCEDATPYLVYWRGGKGYLSTGCAASVSSVCSGYSTTAIMRMENAKNKLFGVNGIGAFVINTDLGIKTAIGLTAPSSAATLAAGAAGGLTGAYSYKITFEYGTGSRGESNPSAASNSVTLAAQVGSLTGIPTGTSGVVTKRYIYRTTSGGSVYYYVDTIANNTTTTYTDTTLDGALGDEVETDNDAPPTAAGLTWHLNMMFYWGNTSAPKRLYFSKIANPEQVPATYFVDVPVPGDSITGLASLPGGLVVFTNAAHYILTGASPDTFRFRILEPDIGCTASNAITTNAGAAYFMFHRQYRRTFGSTSQLLSDNIDNGWAPGLAANEREARAIVWQNRLLVYMFLGTTAYASKTGAADDTAANNRVWGLDLILLDQADDARTAAWFEWTNIFPNVWVVAKGPSQNVETLYWGSNRTTGITYQMSAGGANGAFADDGTAITFRVESQDHAEGDPNLFKDWRNLSALFAGATGQTVTPQYKLDQASSWSNFPAGGKVVTANDGGVYSNRWDMPGQSSGHYGRFAFEETSTSYLLMHGYSTHWRERRDTYSR